MDIQEEERQKGTELCEVIMITNFLKLMRYSKPQIQEDQKAPSRVITNKSIIFKLQKTKGRENVERSQREKQLP